MNSGLQVSRCIFQSSLRTSGQVRPHSSYQGWPMPWEPSPSIAISLTKKKVDEAVRTVQALRHIYIFFLSENFENYTKNT